MIKVVSFDIGGTILFTKSIESYSLKDLAVLLDKPYEAIRTVYKNIFQKEKGSLDELVNKFLKEVNVEPNEEIIKFFKDKYNNKNNEITFDESVIDIIKTLKENGYKIILFSNSCCLLENNLEESFLDLIDKVYYSYDLGYTKDEEESYRIIEKDMNILPEEFLHIGDTLKSDYLKPIENGWKALYLGSNENKEIKQINNLNEVLEIVSGDLWIKYLKKRKSD